MIDFPASPTLGQQFTAAGVTWTWDGTKWTKASGWIEPIKDKVLPLIDSAAGSYVGANTGWPKRTEACDKSS